MTVISKQKKCVTCINVFTTEPANQQKLVELLILVTEKFVRQARGFISASLHRSLDGTKVTMYSQWHSMEDYQSFREEPAPVPYFAEALKIAKFEPGIYEVMETFDGAEERKI